MSYGALQPLLLHQPAEWRGLPEMSCDELAGLLASAPAREPGQLGFYSADRLVFRLEVPSRGLVAYARENRVLLVETIDPPNLETIRELPEPDVVLAQEILVPNAYAPEHLYCDRGLVLTIARPLSGSGPGRLVRCRGIKPLKNPREFGAEYYRPFEDETYWAG
jgi:hypothetical protein